RRWPACSARGSSLRSTPTPTRSSSPPSPSCASRIASSMPSTRRPPSRRSCSGRDAAARRHPVDKELSMRIVASRLSVGLLGLGCALVLAQPADAQKRGGTLTIVRPTDPVSLDPNLETTAPGAWVYFNMLEGLLTLDDKMQVRPLLATSYEVMSPTRVRFKLRS